MKTAVSLPDELFRRADRLAKRLGKSRSRLYQEAIEEFLARAKADVTEEINEALAEIGPDPENERWLRASMSQHAHRRAGR